MHEGPAVIPPVEVGPTLVGMRQGVLGVVGQRRAEGLRGLVLAAELHEGQGPQVEAGGILGVESEPPVGGLERPLPVPTLDRDPGQEAGIVGVLGLEPDRLARGGLGLRQPLLAPEGGAPDVMGEGQVGAATDRLVRLAKRLVDPIEPGQAEREEGVRERVVGVLGQVAAELAVGHLEAALLEQEDSALVGWAHEILRYLRMSS